MPMYAILELSSFNFILFFLSLLLFPTSNPKKREKKTQENGKEIWRRIWKRMDQRSNSKYIFFFPELRYSITASPFDIVTYAHHTLRIDKFIYVGFRVKLWNESKQNITYGIFFFELVLV